MTEDADNETDNWGSLLAAVKQHRRAPLDAVERDRLLDRVVTIGCRTVPEAVACSVTLQAEDGRWVTITEHGEPASRLDGVQYAVGDGPCMRAAATGRLERVDDLQGDPRWPDLARAAADLGVHASLSIPLAERAALNCYGAATRAFVPDRSRALAGFVASVTGDLLGGRERADVAEARRQGDVVRTAQRSLMAARGLDPGAAYHELVTRSAQERRPLLDIAREIS